MRHARSFLFVSALLCLALPVGAAEIPCKPCAGLRLASASAASGTAEIARVLKESGHLEADTPLFVAWEVPLSGEATGAEAAAALHDSGATPWLSLIFHTPPPLAQHSERLQTELRVAAALAGRVPAGTWLQVVWRPEGGETQAFSPTEYAFLLKRAAVAITGARPDARVASQPLPADPQVLRAFYAEEVAAYLEAVVLQPAELQALIEATAAMQEADPGRPVVARFPPSAGQCQRRPWPQPPARPRIGIDLTLFRAPALDAKNLIPTLAPFALLAREFKGDLSYDPSSSPTGAAGGVDVRARQGPVAAGDRPGSEGANPS